MNKEEEYKDSGKLKRLLKGKYRLDCGHRVTFNHNLGSNVMIINGKPPKIICSLCAY